MKNVNFGYKHLFSKVPKSAKRWGMMFSGLSAAITGIGYVAAMPIYMHIGVVCIVLSVVIPFLFGEEDGTDI